MSRNRGSGHPASALIFDEVQYDEISFCKAVITSKLKKYFRSLEHLRRKYKNADTYEKELVELVRAFISCISLLKYQAFFEEREIRIVVFTNPKEGILEHNLNKTLF